MSLMLGALVIQNLLAHNCSFEPKLPLPGNTQICFGRVGTMKTSDIIGAIQTSAKRHGILGDSYKEEHTIYSAIIDALYGIFRGNMMLQESVRSTYLNYAIARGLYYDTEPGDWLIVALYGSIGSTTKGHEHEAIGVGIKPL